MRVPAMGLLPAWLLLSSCALSWAEKPRADPALSILQPVRPPGRRLLPSRAPPDEYGTSSVPNPPPGATSVPNPKRGFVADPRNGTCADPSLLSTSSWYYDYNSYDPYRHHLNCSSGAAQEFVPMHWCWSHATPPVYVPGPPYLTNDSVRYFLGFNEVNAPNQCGGGKATPASTAAEWRPMAAQIHHSYHNAQLVSPATAALTRVGAETISWFQEFFGNCSSLYGPSGCGIERVAVHYYGCNATETMAYLRSVYEAFRRPIWLTEFSCGHAPQPSTHAAYLRELLPQLDAATFVQRYAWMSSRAKGSGSARALLVPGQAKLTELGELYNSL